MTTKKRAKSPNPPKNQVKYSTSTHKESYYPNPPSKVTINQALVPVSSNSGVANSGRARIAPEVIKLYDCALGKVVVNHLYSPMLRYSHDYCSRATSYFITKGSKTFDLRCDKDMTEALEEILLGGSGIECLTIQEVKIMGLKNNHYAFQLKI